MAGRKQGWIISTSELGEGMTDTENRATGDLPAIPPTDQERQGVLDRLRQHCAEGRISLEEFSDRVSLALAALSGPALAETVADLPAQAEPVRLQRGLAWSLALFGTNRKKARWRLDRKARAVAVVGACWLDLREASIDADEVTITALAVFGTIKVVVPAGIGVELSGLPLFGAKTDATSGRVIPEAPVVRVRGFPIFGSVRVIESEPAKPAPTPAELRLQEDMARKVLGLAPISRDAG